MPERSDAIVRTLAMLTHARRSRKRPCALVKDRTLQTLVADLVAARTAAGMTQHEVAMRMWTTKSAVSRLESGFYSRPTLDTIEKYALAVDAQVELRVRPRLQLAGARRSRGRCRDPSPLPLMAVNRLIAHASQNDPMQSIDLAQC